MQTYLLPLVGRQRPRLLPDPRVDRDAAEIVEKGSPADRDHTRVVDTRVTRGRGGQFRDSR